MSTAAALHGPAGGSDASPLLGILAQFSRRQLASAVEVMIALMDAQDGDTDTEEDDPDHEHDGSEPDDWRNP